MNLFRRAAVLGSLAGSAALGVGLAQNTQVTEAQFRAECLSKAQAAEKTKSLSVPGRDGWRFLVPELKHVAAGKFWSGAESTNPLPAILDFKQQLERAGIELLLVPVPPKAIIFPDKLAAKVALSTETPPRFDSVQREFFALLRHNGVQVLDLAPEFLARRADANADPIYCKQDSHWSGRGCVLAARGIAKAIASRDWLPSAPRQKLALSWKRIAMSGDLSASSSARETLPVRFVGAPASTWSGVEPVQPNRESPVLLLGDSHNLIFHAGDDMHARGAGLPDQLAAELGFAVEVMAVRGSGATPARVNLMRRVRANSDYLKHLKLVVWCFSAREFTQSPAWRKLAIAPAS